MGAYLKIDNQRYKKLARDVGERTEQLHFTLMKMGGGLLEKGAYLVFEVLEGA